MHRPLLALALLVPALALAADEPAKPYPAVPPPKDKDALGRGVQRTLTLLAASTAKKRNKVRILFYGQSISEQDWSKQVAADLRRRFPHAELEVANRAIGGFASQRLVHPAEHDLYPFYPDLLIFHVYGSDKEYEQTIKNVRTRTAAEVLMQTDHLTRRPPEKIDPVKDRGAWWDDRMNRSVLPAIAKKYGCGLVDVRAGWADYLKAHKLEPKALLKDGVHLNDHGNRLMAALVGRHLVHRPDLKDDSWKGMVKTFEVGKDVAWKGGKLTLAFEGNRVDVLAAKAGGKATVRIDGKKPSEFPSAYAVTRPTPGPWSPLALVRVDHDKPPVVEDWTLKVTTASKDGTEWGYEVTGSRTGPDGAGSSDKVFVSKSGRVKIGAADKGGVGSWFRAGQVKPGYTIKWRVVPLFVDEYEPPAVKDDGREYATTLIQGLPNGKHTVELTAEGKDPPALKAVRMYKPPVK